MDGDRFDNLTRALAAGRSGATSRRTFLAGLAGGALAAAGVLPTRRAKALVSQAHCSNKSCKNNPAVCTNGCVCCVYGNGNSRCRPPGTCSSGQTVCPPGLVPNAAGGCVCAPGFADCDGNLANGCETPLGTNANCGFCGDICAGPGETCGAVTAGVCGCVDNGAACAGRTCGTAVNNCGVTVNCGPLGGACPQGQSCSGAGTCACPPGICGEGCTRAICPDSSCKQGATGACAADGDCCSGVCVGGACQGGCVAEGGVCDSGPDCCAGACVTPVSGAGAQLCCASGTACGIHCCSDAAQVCDGSGACCTPRTCQPGQCGPHPDGCGRGLDCGGCTVAGETCGGGGTPGVCGTCIPADPATVCAGRCGTVSDGCGGTITCSTCGAGLTCCNGACVNLSNDVDNCRECGRVCESDPETCTSATCVGGNCVFSTVFNCCHSDDECLDSDINPCSVDTCDPRTLTCRHDPAADNTPCGGGQVCCAGACMDVASDPTNCGACGNTCVENQPCEPCPTGQLCPDRGPGCCETGTCNAGRCSASLPICANCATPLCDPIAGPICVDNCPPPDACHTGPGVCHFDGSCVYEPKCPCADCDPGSGNCSASSCTATQFCVENQCVDGFVCAHPNGDETLCPPNASCAVTSLDFFSSDTSSDEVGCCPPNATLCPIPLSELDLCCPASDTCLPWFPLGGGFVPRCSSLSFTCASSSVDGIRTLVECSPDTTCGTTFDLATSTYVAACCPEGSVQCEFGGISSGLFEPLCCPQGDTCEAVDTIVGPRPVCSSSGNVCPGDPGSPAAVCGPADTCVTNGCCPPDGVICTSGLPLVTFTRCCPHGDFCTFTPTLLPACASEGVYCPVAGTSGICSPGETCAIDLASSTADDLFVCCPADHVSCPLLHAPDLSGTPGLPDNLPAPFLSNLVLCCPANDTCESDPQPGGGTIGRCSSTPPPG